MEFKGTVQGSSARRFAGFTYRKPILPRVDIFQLDPERLHPANEYPRSVNPPSQPDTQVVDLADYTVRIGSSGGDGLSPLQVWMQPNKYTQARAPMLVSEVKVANANIMAHEYRDESLRRVFGAQPDTRKKHDLARV